MKNTILMVLFCLTSLGVYTKTSEIQNKNNNVLSVLFMNEKKDLNNALNGICVVNKFCFSSDTEFVKQNLSNLDTLTLNKRGSIKKVVSTKGCLVFPMIFYIFFDNKVEYEVFTDNGNVKSKKLREIYNTINYLDTFLFNSIVLTFFCCVFWILKSCFFWPIWFSQSLYWIIILYLVIIILYVTASINCNLYLAIPILYYALVSFAIFKVVDFKTTKEIVV